MLSWNIDHNCNELCLNPDRCQWVVITEVIILRPNNENGDWEQHLENWEYEFLKTSHACILLDKFIVIIIDQAVCRSSQENDVVH